MDEKKPNAVISPSLMCAKPLLVAAQTSPSGLANTARTWLALTATLGALTVRDDSTVTAQTGSIQASAKTIDDRSERAGVELHEVDVVRFKKISCKSAPVVYVPSSVERRRGKGIHYFSCIKDIL